MPPPTPAHCEKSCLVELFEPRLAHLARRERPQLLFMLLVQPTLDVEPERFHLGGEGGGGWVGGVQRNRWMGFIREGVDGRGESVCVR